jgi:hypothetical protein
MARVHLHKPRLSRPVLWAGLCVAAAAVTVQITRTGVDVLALMVAAFVLLCLERTVGDWIADSLGPAATALVFAGVAGFGVWYMLSVGGRAKAQLVFAAAEARGYHTMFVAVDNDAVKSDDGEDARAISDAVRGAGDAITSAPVDARAVSPAPRTTSGTAPPSRRVQPSGGGGVGGGGGVPSVRAPGIGAPGPAVPGGGDVGTSSGSGLGSPGDDLGDMGPLRITRLILNPEVVMTGDRVTLRAMITGRGELPALVEFSIDGHTVSTAEIGRDSIAKTTFSTRTPGSYTVRARIVGGPMRITEVSALLNVLPGRR